MTSITFESATVIDVIKKAARIAPGKAGSSFDKAWGIIMQVTPDEEVKCLVRATNTDAYYVEVVGCVEASGEDAVWRLPSQLLASTVGTLPIGTGKQIKFTQNGNKVKIESGRMKVTVNLGDPAMYPEWDMFDGSTLTPVSALGGRIAMVEWAALGGGEPPLSGIYLDGEYIWATNRYNLARTPLKVNLTEPIVVPSGILGASLKAMGDTAVGVSGSMFNLMPDDYTQLKTLIYDVQYPAVDKLARTDYPVSVEVHKSVLVDILNRANQFAGAERMPLLRMYFGKGEIAAMMQNDEIGLLGDAIEVSGQIQHKRVEIRFTPKYIIDGIAKAPNDKITIKYDPDEPGRLLYIDGGSGYECWVMPRRDSPPQLS